MPDSTGLAKRKEERPKPSGITSTADVPSGRSTGSYEARELRDGGTRFGGSANLEAFTETRWVTILADIAHYPF